MQKIVSYQVFGTPPSTPVFILDSTGSSCVSSDPNTLLEFLRYKQSDCLRVFWDLDESLAPIFRLLNPAILQSLCRFDENTHYGEHQLYYLQGRSARIGRSRLYGIQSFWPTDYPEPDSLEELQSRAEELLETLALCGMPNPIKLTSPIAVFEGTELGKQVYEPIPKGYDLPTSVWGALEYAYKCDRREWITAYQCGKWDEGSIWDYDLSSAYPSVASKLLDIRNMEIWHSDTFGIREESASYGFLCGDLGLDPTSPLIHTSPIMTDLERMPGNPAGYFPDYYLTLGELRYAQSCDMAKFIMRDGWFLKLYNGAVISHPFADIEEKLYRSRSRSELAASIMKGIANQLIGKLIETKVSGDYGDLRNDIYHALILAQTRVKVAEFLVHNDITADELVTVQTDGVKLTRNIECIGSGMGKWRNNGSQPTIVASPYKVYSGDKKPGHLTYGAITSMIKAHPLSSYYGSTVNHRTTLKQAVQRGDISLVGGLEDLPAHLDLSHIEREQNRDFGGLLPRTGTALLNNQYRSKAVIV